MRKIKIWWLTLAVLTITAITGFWVKVHSRVAKKFIKVTLGDGVGDLLCDVMEKTEAVRDITSDEHEDIVRNKQGETIN